MKYFTRRHALLSFAAAFPLVSVVGARNPRMDPRTLERVYVERACPLTQSPDFQSDTMLFEVAQEVFHWTGQQQSGEWSAKDLARYLRSVYSEVALEPALLPEYKYVKDAQCVIHEICIGQMVMTMLPRSDADRVRVRIERWMPAN